MIEVVEGRQCGGCSLCCRLLPVREGVKGKDGTELFRTFDKPAGQRCQHQRSTGCSIYEKRPVSCRLWHCMWLMGAPELSHRPDRVGYCVDMQPDFITASGTDQKEVKIPAVQVWVDPAKPDAHREPGLRRYLDKLGREKGMVAIIRYSPMEGFVLFPPALCGDGQWHEKESNVRREYEHTPEEIVEVLEAMEHRNDQPREDHR